ncbi:MAG: ATP-binding protein [Pseudobdellovibrionaceae bacterium]
MQNFWEKTDWESEDRHLLSLKNMPFQRPFPAMTLGSGLFIIRGPRQVGKSCWIKTLLSEQDPKNCYYLSCENIRDHLDLAEVFKSQSNRKIFFLDEITFVDKWWRAVKHQMDSSINLTIVLTGSHSQDLKAGADRMPGRFGKGGEFELLPMTYPEYIDAKMQAGWKIEKEQSAELEKFFRVGGFPIAVMEGGESGKIPLGAIEVYKKWLLGDLIKLGKQEVFLKELLSQVALSMTSTISLQKLAQKTQMGSHMTAQAYVEILEACFALRTLYAINPEENHFHFKKQKKFYFRDPLIYWLAFSWADIEFPKNAMPQIAEMVAGEMLGRRYQRFGYWSNKNGEVDFLSPKRWAIEIKWGDESHNLSKAYKDLRIPQKMVWSKNNFLQEWP